MQLIPTIYFPGICSDAISFYRDALAAELLFQATVGSITHPQPAKPGTENKIMRAGLRIGGKLVYLSDGHGAGQPAFAGFSLTLDLPGRAEAERVLQALAEGGQVQVPLRQTQWAESFATVLDKFGVHWVIQAGLAAPLRHAMDE